eukprot:3532534-Rhodomonas_salina.1
MQIYGMPCMRAAAAQLLQQADKVSAQPPTPIDGRVRHALRACTLSCLAPTHPLIHSSTYTPVRDQREH